MARYPVFKDQILDKCVVYVFLSDCQGQFYARIKKMLVIYNIRQKHPPVKANLAYLHNMYYKTYYFYEQQYEQQEGRITEIIPLKFSSLLLY
jgi:hypothetical protein